MAELNVIGMIEGQCRRMLLWESFCYKGLSVLFTDTVGVAISYGLVRMAGFLYDFVDCNFDFMSLLMGNLVFLLAAPLAALAAYRALGRKQIGLRLQKFH